MNKIPPYSSFLRGPSVRTLWNYQQRRPEYTIGKYRASAGERPDTNTDRILLGVWCGGGPVESRDENGIYIPNDKTDAEGPLNIYPSGKVPGVRRVRSSDFILIEIEPGFVRDIRQELGNRRHDELQLQLGFHDSTLQRLVETLAEEADQGFNHGPIFTDHIIHALTIRLLLQGESNKVNVRHPFSGLPPHILKRVMALMHDSAASLDLQTLAAESGYSRYHFLRMFHRATGLTPYAYLMRLRLERAKVLLRQNRSAAYVAEACGFSSQSHFSRAFRRAFGQTPTEFRRNP